MKAFDRLMHETRRKRSLNDSVSIFVTASDLAEVANDDRVTGELRDRVLTMRKFHMNGIEIKEFGK